MYKLQTINLQLHGGGSWTPKEWGTYSKTHIASKATVDGIYTSRGTADVKKNNLDPKGITMRESCDSADNPNATPVIVALDVTGSMSSVLEVIARTGLKVVAEELYARKPISDPHIMFMGIGDCHARDQAPLQVTQFEADIRIAEQLTKIWLEMGGGGNSYEGYALAWYFAGMHTRLDSMDKRGKKGYLFTIGDELPTPYLSNTDIFNVMGYKPQQDNFTTDELFAMASRNYEVFHIIVEEGSFCRSQMPRVTKAWRDVMGQRVIVLSDHTKLGEAIISAIQVVEGEKVADVVSSWDGSTGLVVAKAMEGLVDLAKVDSKSGVVKFS